MKVESKPGSAQQRNMRMGEMKKGQTAVIRRVGGDDAELARRLLEMGLLEGSRVELMHEAPFGGDPVAVRVRGALLALRRNEANDVEVEIL